MKHRRAGPRVRANRKACFCCGSIIPVELDFRKFDDDKRAQQEAFLKWAHSALTKLDSRCTPQK